MGGVYLGEPYDPERPGTQVFLAPGPDDEPMIEGISPWVFGRMVRIPARYWHRVLLALHDIDPEAARIVDRWSGTADPDDDEGFTVDEPALRVVETAVSRLDADLDAGSAIPEADRAAIGDASIWDYHRMLVAVLAVFRKAADRGEPFDAWFE